MKTPTLAPDLLDAMDAYWRAASYLSHLAMDAFDRVPQAGEKVIALKQRLQEKMYIEKIVHDIPVVCDWQWQS